jgi:hypothetical protein
MFCTLGKITFAIVGMFFDGSPARSLKQTLQIVSIISLVTMDGVEETFTFPAVSSTTVAAFIYIRFEKTTIVNEERNMCRAIITSCFNGIIHSLSIVRTK